MLTRYKPTLSDVILLWVMLVLAAISTGQPYTVGLFCAFAGTMPYLIIYLIRRKEPEKKKRRVSPPTCYDEDDEDDFMFWVAMTDRDHDGLPD